MKQTTGATRRSSDPTMTRPFSARRLKPPGVGSEPQGCDSIRPCSVAAPDVAGTLSTQQRVLRVKVEIDWKDAISKKLFEDLRDLGWADARYRNDMIARKWAESKGWIVPEKDDQKHSVTKQGRAEQKDLGEPVKSAAEREVEGAWKRHAKEIFAGRPLPQWKPTAALSLRGRKDKRESGVRLELEGGQYVAYLRARSKHCAEGTWLRLPIARNTRRDEHQGGILDRMVSGETPIAKAAVQMKRSAVTLWLTYAIDITLPQMGSRIATLGPVRDDGRLLLRTELQTKNYTAKLHLISERKTHWDLQRRRILAQIGWRKGHARAKRKALQKMTWEEWLRNHLHTWSREIADWLKSQGVGTLQVQSIDTGDWPAYQFVALLTYKCGEYGIQVGEMADLGTNSAERSAKQEVSRDKRRTKKRAEAVRELTHQLKGSTT